jgi:transcriptional regulator GlxA family with amidase domain
MRTVAVLAYPGASIFGIGVTAEVFGVRRPGLPEFDYTVAAERPGMMRTDVGMPIRVTAGLAELARADLAIVPCWDDPSREPTKAMCDAFRAVLDRGGLVMSHCTGAFVLASAGILDGRRATTDWRRADELAQRFPAVTVDASVLYIDEGNVITSAGTAAGIDASLYLLRREYGSAVANAFARNMVVAPHRDGGQAQFIDATVPDEPVDDHLRAATSWALHHLDEALTVDALAQRAHTSPRTFARRFVAHTGTTPHKWLTHQRLLRAAELLEGSDLPVESVAARVGLAPVMLRRHFAETRGASPQSYRRSFRGAAPTVESVLGRSRRLPDG